MADWNGFKGAAKRLDDIDIPRIGHRIGVGEDEIHAFMDVEASGSGFDDQGRPKMLFEPHVFYRNLEGEGRRRAVREGLAYAKWRPGEYPADSYPRLTEAMAIDETAALRSASWGLGQILGENHTMVGYPTVQDMVRAFMEDEEIHLDAMVSFIIAAGIDDDLKAHRWETVARVYNGPQHARHNYAGRMRDRFRWWQGKRDTPWEPDVPVPTPRPVQEPATIGHNGGPALAPAQDRPPLDWTGQKGDPALSGASPPTKSIPTPVEQSSKAVGAGKWAGLAAAIWQAIIVADVLPAPYDSTEFSTAVMGIIATVAAIVGSYRAQPNAEPVK